MAEDYMSDEFVAGLIKDEAKQATKDYAMYGLSAYFPKRPTTEAPKPNKRFLRTILRDTDTHNQALLAKEAEDSQARLRALRREEERKTRRSSNDYSSRRYEEDEDRHHSKRRRVDVQARDKNRLSPPKEFTQLSPRRDRSLDRNSRRDERRRRRRDTSESGEEYKRRYKGSEDHSKRERYSRLSRHHDRRRSTSSRRRRSDSEDDEQVDKKSIRRRHRRNGEGYSDDESRERNRDRRRSKHESRDYHDISPERSKIKPYRSHREQDKHRRSRSPHRDRKHDDTRRRYRSHSAERRDSKTKAQKSSREFSPAATHNGHKQDAPDGDSDPLEELVGPLPPPPPPKVKVRGRGAASSMAMDSRFNSGYDPSVDITLDAMEDDDWGQTKEALQAQAKFKQNQAERLLAAGFTEAEVKSWTKGGEKNEDDVQWAKRGEGREWDRGKTVDEDKGTIDLEPSWGRLKGT